MSFNFGKGPWYQLIFTSNKAVAKVPGHEAMRLLQKGKKLYEESDLYGEEVDEMTAQILQSGTLKDKFTQMKVIAEETPLMMLEHLDTLNEMMHQKPRIAVDAMHAASEIFTKYLLPDDRQLRVFQDQPIRNASDKLLIMFYFEDQLKVKYAEFIKNIEHMAKGQQSFIRDPAIRCIGQLLKAKPEAEMALLTILVDKFGDPLKAVAAVATQTIKDVLRNHPGMSKAVIKAINQKGFTDENSEKRAKKFIGQIDIASKEDNTAQELWATVKPSLLDCLNNYDESKSKVLQSLMRAAEKCAESLPSQDTAEFIDPLYKFLEKSSSTLTISLPVLHLLFSIHKTARRVPRRFYEILYQVLINQQFQNASKQAPTLNLIMNALMEESDVTICCSFLHRLLHVGLQMNVSFAVAVLVFCSKMLENKPDLKSILTSSNKEAEDSFDFEGKSCANAGSESTFPWILSLYVKHYHPGVCALAKQLIMGKSVEYSSDAFDDFATTKQLKRLVSVEGFEAEGFFAKKCFEEWDAIPDFIGDEEVIEDRKNKREEYAQQKAGKIKPPKKNKKEQKK